jgi:uncharacterized protein
VASSILIAFGLFLVLEGLMPFLYPEQWRKAFLHIAQMSNGQIRFFGLVALLCGILLLLSRI